jgi:hypothetical protein
VYGGGGGDWHLNGVWRLDVPHFWTPAQCEFAKNEGTWCASNLLREKEHVTWKTPIDVFQLLERLAGEDKCLCRRLSFAFSRVLDDTPKRELRASSNSN